MLKKYGWLWFLAIVFLLIVGIWFWRYWSTPTGEKLQLKTEVTNVNIYEINDDRIKLKTRVTFINPFPVALSTKKLTYQGFIDSVKVVESSYGKPIKIPAAQQGTVELPMEILVKSAKAILEKLDKQKRDSADYSLKSTVEADVPIAGQREFHLEFSKRLPALRIPKGELEKVHVDKLGFKETKLDLVLKIENPNVFPLKLDDGYYKVKVDDDLDMDGFMEKHMDIPARQSAPLTMHLVLKTLKAGQLAWRSLFEKKSTHYNVVFTGKLSTENKMLDQSRFSMTMHGTLDDLKK